MTTDHAALCRKLLAALIETRHVAAFALGDHHGPLPPAHHDWLTRANAAIREAHAMLAAAQDAERG